MSDPELRNGVVSDAATIAAIIERVWPESETNYERLVRVLALPTHVTLVSCVDEAVVGFINGFMTTSADGKARWEVDLLAVDPQYQRRGIGRSLITALTFEGQKHGGEMARGLIALDNKGSESAFESCGYVTDSVLYDLMVMGCTESSTGSVVGSDEAYLVEVSTFNYSGLWVDGNHSPSVFERALTVVSRTQYDLVGAVVPVSDDSAIEAAAALGFDTVGRYRWWVRPL